MKKDFMKGILVGICLTLFLSVTIPVLAQAFSAEFNVFRLRGAGGTIAEWGENFLLEDGRTVPSSILYNGTIYLPMPLINNAVCSSTALFNGDSNTISLTNLSRLDRNFQFIFDKPDTLGNIWMYSIEHGNINYLRLWDWQRQYGRLYQLLGAQSIQFFDEYVLFVTVDNMEWHLVKLYYANDPDSQDGEIVYTLNEPLGDAAILDNNTLFYVARTSEGTVTWNVAIRSVCLEGGEISNILDLNSLYPNIQGGLVGPVTVRLQRVEEDYLFFTYTFTPPRGGFRSYYKVNINGLEPAVRLSDNN